MSFQYFSDLHLEFFKHFRQIDKLGIQPCAPYLIVAGDISSMTPEGINKYERFLTLVSKMFTYVFIISGNHEYYQSRKRHNVTGDWLSVVDSTIQNIAKTLPNIIYLQNTKFDLPNTNISVYGTTLWSAISKDEESIVRTAISDYCCIPQFTTTKSTELFENNVQSLKETLEQNKEKMFVVISHHLPSYELIAEQYKSCGINSAFASSVELAKSPQIVAWVAGHTHMPIELGKFHVNPVGYRGENSIVNVNKTFQII